MTSVFDWLLHDPVTSVTDWLLHDFPLQAAFTYLLAEGYWLVLLNTLLLPLLTGGTLLLLLPLRAPCLLSDTRQGIVLCGVSSADNIHCYTQPTNTQLLSPH